MSYFINAMIFITETQWYTLGSNILALTDTY